MCNLKVLFHIVQECVDCHPFFSLAHLETSSGVCEVCRRSKHKTTAKIRLAAPASCLGDCHRGWADSERPDFDLFEKVGIQGYLCVS